jgi:hypothetical protein
MNGVSDGLGISIRECVDLSDQHDTGSSDLCSKASQARHGTLRRLSFPAVKIGRFW